MSLDTLPNCCALIAVSACYELARHGIRCQPLAITFQRKPEHRHIVTVFAFEDVLRVYDSSGTVTLPTQLRFSSRPKAIAEAWAADPSVEFPHKVLKGEWY